MLFDILDFLLLLLNGILVTFLTDSDLREILFVDKNKTAISSIVMILLLDCIFINNYLI